MLSKDRIIKLDVLLSDEENSEILTVTNKQFTFQSSSSGRTDTLLIIKGHKLLTIPVGKDVSIITHMRNGQRIKYPSIILLSTELQLNIIVKDRQQIMPERRNNFKVKTDLTCTINSIERDNAPLPLKSPIMAHLNDLSVGGTFLAATQDIEFKIKDNIAITIFFGEKNTNLSLEVVRVQTNAVGEIVGYGCRFTHLTPSKEETLAKYVFGIQRNSINND